MKSKSPMTHPMTGPMTGPLTGPMVGRPGERRPHVLRLRMLRKRDTTAPVVTLSSISTNARQPALAGTVDDPTATIIVTLAGQTYPAVNAGNGTWSLPANTIASLADGTHPASVTATDAAGNVGTASGSIYVDSTAPAVTVTAISLTKFRQPALSGTVDDPTATVVVTVGGLSYPATVSSGAWSIPAGTIAALADGVHTVSATATDPIGNVGSASATVRVDATPPVVTLTTSAIYFAAAQLTGTVNDATATVQVIVGGLSYPATISGSTWTTTSEVPLALGNNSVQVQATDPAGNVGSVSGTVYRFSPQLLFAANEPGWFFEQNDLGTQFADVAGTTPITGPNQSVALQLDKSRGLVLGAQLIANGDFSSGSTGWLLQPGWTISGGELTASSVAAYQSSVATDLTTALVPGKTYEVKYEIISISGAIRVQLTGGSTTNLAPRSTSGTHKELFTASTSTARVGFQATVAGTTAVIDNISIRELPGAHRIQPTAASRPMLRQDATTGLRYYEWDAQDDWMQTAASVDFSSTDKVTVACGLRKLSDAATGIITELSVDSGANDGAFAIVNTSLAPGSYRAVLRGTVSRQDATTTGSKFPAPNTAVVLASLDLAGVTDDAKVGMRVNGAQQALNHTPTLSRPAFRNDIVYFSSRGGTTLRFNGHTSCDFAIGRLLTPTELLHLERWVASRTPGAVLAA